MVADTDVRPCPPAGRDFTTGPSASGISEAIVKIPEQKRTGQASIDTGTIFMSNEVSSGRKRDRFRSAICSRSVPSSPTSKPVLRRSATTFGGRLTWSFSLRFGKTAPHSPPGNLKKVTIKYSRSPCNCTPRRLNALLLRKYPDPIYVRHESSQH